jgi:cation diffusion facilitator family transporter
MSHESHAHDHDYVIQDSKIGANEKKTMFVVGLTFITMIVEVSYGYITGSMALLADGWHMASHVGALGISLVVYRLARSKNLNQKFSFGAGKLIPLGGYTSALMLGLVAIFMAVESITRFLNPTKIDFSIAIWVSVVGLIVNLVSALLLKDSHDHHHGHDEHHHHNHDDHVHDHNHQSALVHVIADAFTSVLAIVALVCGKYFGWNWADPVMGIVGSIVILKWAYGLCKATIWELLDGNSKLIKEDDIKKIFSEDKNVEITDLHVWRIAPNAHACEVVIYNNDLKGSEFYRTKILENFNIEHLIVEERTCIH